MSKILLVLLSMLILSSVVSAHIDENWDSGTLYWTIDEGIWPGVDTGGWDGGKYITSTISGMTNRYLLNKSYGSSHNYFSIYMNRSVATDNEDVVAFAFETNSSTTWGAGGTPSQCNGVVNTNIKGLCIDHYSYAPRVRGIGFSYNTTNLPVDNQLMKYEVFLAGTNARIRIYYINDTLYNEQITAFTHLDGNKNVILWVGTTGIDTVTGNFDDLVIADADPAVATTGTINFDESRYDLGDIAYISGSLINPDYATYNYRTVIIDPLDNIINAHTWVSGSLTETNYPLNINIQGTYTVKLQRYRSAISYDYLSTDTAIAGYENNQSLSTTFYEYYYNTGDTVIINSNISNIDNSNYFYEVMILKPNGNFYNVHNITANESYNFVTNVPGEWQVSLTSYPKSAPSMIENQVSDTMFTYGSVQGASWVTFNDTYYNKNSWARINYGISVNDFVDSHKMQIINQEGTVVFDRQITAQSGYFDYYFYESGKYTVTIDRNWFALDWDLTDNEILATDVTEVTNTIEGGFTLGVTPTTLNCGQTVYLSAETPNFWNTTNFTIKDVNGTLITTILGQSGKWKTNQTGQFWVYLNDAGAVQDTGYFYVYGTCTGYDVMNPDGNGGIKPKPYPQTDQATSNAALQNNFLYFMGLPIFWGMIIFIGVLIIAAVNKAGAAIPYLAPGVLLFEAVIGLLDPYSSFIIVGFAIIAIMYFVGNFVANRAGN